MKYPKTRRITWVNEQTGEMEGQCDYVREDILGEAVTAMRQAVDSVAWDTYGKADLSKIKAFLLSHAEHQS